MNKFDFDIIASDYDNFYNDPKGKLIDEIEKKSIGKLIRKIEGNLLVELGCGTGHWTSFFSSKGFTVMGLDISTKMLGEAIKKEIPNSIFLKQDIQELPFIENSIQNIAAIASLEFVGNQEKVFSEIKRVLKPGGSLLVGCINIDSQTGKTKSDNPVFKDAVFFSYKTLFEKLSSFGKPEIYGCLFLNEKNEIMDNQVSEDELLNNGVFLSGIVKKEY